MLRFAICDDNELQRDVTRECLTDALGARADETEIVCFPGGTELIADVRRGGGYDVYILDMIMPGMNGLETATTLRILHDEGAVIFLTSSTEYAVQSYDVRAYYYMLKPLDSRKFAFIIGNLLKELPASREETISIKTHDGVAAVKLRDIFSVSLENRCPVYRLRDSRRVTGLWMRGRFREEMAPLLTKPYFAECGVSMLVNLNCIDAMDSESLLMSGGSVLHPPKSAAAGLMKKWMDFKRK